MNNLNKNPLIQSSQIQTNNSQIPSPTHTPKLLHILFAMFIGTVLMWTLATIIPSNHSYEGGSLFSGEVYNWEQKHGALVQELSADQQKLFEKKQQVCLSEKEGAEKKLKANSFDPKNNPLTEEEMVNLKYKRDERDCSKVTDINF